MSHETGEQPPIPGLYGPETPLDAPVSIEEAEILERAIRASTAMTQAKQVIPEEKNVWRETGGGDRKSLRLQTLGQELATGVMELSGRYSPLIHKDLTQFKLQTTLLIIAQLGAANYRNIENYVEDFVHGPEPDVTESDKNRAMRLHDGLGLLNNAFNFVIVGPNGKRTDELIEEFTANHESELWKNEEAAEDTFRCVDTAYRIIGELTAPERDSIQGFVKKLQVELLKKIDIPPAPRHGSTRQQRTGYQKKVGNRRVMAWADWNALPEPTQEVPEGELAEVVSLFPELGETRRKPV